MTVYCHLCPVSNFCKVGKPEISAQRIQRPSETVLIEVMIDVTRECPLKKMLEAGK